jgi:hypothetical protein
LDSHGCFRSILSEIVDVAEESGEPRLREFIKPMLGSDHLMVSGFSGLLKYWAELDPRPLVLFLDEVDTLVGDTLSALLRMLRTRLGAL